MAMNVQQAAGHTSLLMLTGRRLPDGCDATDVYVCTEARDVACASLIFMPLVLAMMQREWGGLIGRTMLLQRRASDEEPMRDAEKTDGLRQHGRLVLDAVRLVYDDVEPLELGSERRVGRRGGHGVVGA